MKTKFDNDRLLSEMVLDDSGTRRDVLLDQTLGTARRVRRRRRAGRAVLLATALAVVALVGFRTIRPDRMNRPADLSVAPIARQEQVASQSYLLVTTTALSKAQIVATLPPVRIVQTVPDPFLRILNDDELLAMAPPTSLLQRIGPGNEELILGQ